MKKINLVLARYNENIDWIFSEKREFKKIFIFNKGNDLNINDLDIEVFKFENFGRESTSYLNFIINNYDYLLQNDDLVVFSQAYPFDSSANFIKKIKDGLPEDKAITLSDAKAEQYVFANLSKDNCHINGLPFINYYNHLFFSENLNLNNSLKETMEFNGLWSVPSKNIVFRKKEFYLHCLSMFRDVKNPLEGYIFERLWKYIFDGKTLDWISHYEFIRQNYAVGSYKNLKID